jgi:hypothetical protein
MKTCFEIEIAGIPVKLEQRANKTFRVTYGKQVNDHEEYFEASLSLGSAIFHALACEGKLDNEGP